MKTLQVQLPESVHVRLNELARTEGVSLNQVIVTAATNEVARSETHEFFARASDKFDQSAFSAALAVVPDVAPADGDEI